MTQTDSSGKKKKIYFYLSGTGFITVNKPFDPDGQFPIVEAKNGNFMISVVQSLNKAPVITLEIADPAKKEAK